MGVDTSLQYNGYNSYKFEQNDFLICYPFGVENMEYITHSFGAYSPIALDAKVRAYTRFFNADGEEIKLENHSFAVQQGTFDKVEITVSVPALAVKAELKFLNNEAQPWWVATPKTEEGQNATPYAINAYGQLTYITPNGIYTGTITANQVVLASGGSLPERLTKINANGVYTGEVVAEQIRGGEISGVSIKIGNNFSVDEDGKLTGTNAKLSGTIEATKITSTANPNYYGEMGVTDGYIGLGLFDKSTSNEAFCEILKATNGGFLIRDINNQTRFYASTNSTSLRDSDGKDRFYASNDFTYLRDSDEKIRFYASTNSTSLRDSDGKTRFFASNDFTHLSDINSVNRVSITNDTTYIRSPDQNTQISVSNGNIVFIVKGTVKEVW